MDFHIDYPCTYLPNGGDSMLRKKYIDELFRTRKYHLEKFTAAFISDVGCAEASKYQLMERTTGLDTTWYFVKLED